MPLLALWVNKASISASVSSFAASPLITIIRSPFLASANSGVSSPRFFRTPLFISVAIATNACSTPGNLLALVETDIKETESKYVFFFMTILVGIVFS